MSNKGKGQGHSKPPKFTAQELMDLHGLTVEQALAKGYEVVGHSRKSVKINDKPIYKKQIYLNKCGEYNASQSN